MKVQGNRYINNPEMIKNKVEKKTTVPQNIISEDDVKISDSARKLVETARDKVSDFQAMHFSSINGEIKEIPAEYKCENLFKLDLKATSISGEQSAFEGCSDANIIGKDDFLEVFVSTPLEECEKRDVKGLYAKARKGEIQNFTGISAPFEVPEHPALSLDTSKLTLEESVNRLLELVLPKVKCIK